MKLSKINELLALLANLGVIAGIIFLAVELNQNTTMMQAQTRDSISGKLSDFFMDVATNEYANDLWFRGRRGDFEPDPADIEEWQPYMFMVMSNLLMWENEWYQYQAGLFGEDEFAARTSSWSYLLRFPGYKLVWERTKGNHEREFVDFIDSLIGA